MLSRYCSIKNSSSPGAGVTPEWLAHPPHSLEVRPGLRFPQSFRFTDSHEDKSEKMEAWRAHDLTSTLYSAKREERKEKKTLTHLTYSTSGFWPRVNVRGAKRAGQGGETKQKKETLPRVDLWFWQLGETPTNPTADGVEKAAEIWHRKEATTRGESSWQTVGSGGKSRFSRRETLHWIFIRATFGVFRQGNGNFLGRGGAERADNSFIIYFFHITHTHTHAFKINRFNPTFVHFAFFLAARMAAKRWMSNGWKNNNNQ